MGMLKKMREMVFRAGKTKKGNIYIDFKINGIFRTLVRLSLYLSTTIHSTLTLSILISVPQHLNYSSCM